MTWDAILFGAFLGFAMLPIVYNTAFYLVMRERFLIWHSLRLAAIMLMAMLGTDIALGGMFDDPVIRNHAELLLLDLGIAMTGPFLLAYIEPDKIGLRLSRALAAIMPVALLLAVIPLVVYDDPFFNTVRHLGFLAILVVLMSGLAVALRNGSRAARFQLVAWIPVLGVSLVAVTHEVVFNDQWPLWLSAIIVAMAFEVVVSALGVADRFLAQRKRWNEGLAETAILRRLAETDQLTGLPNRRKLEQEFADMVPQAMAVIDIDGFRAINERFGHDVADAVLVAAAEALGRDDRFAARLRGDRFALLLAGDDWRGEAMIARALVETAVAVRVAGLDTAVTAGMGLVEARAGTGFGEMLRRTEACLTSAKRHGADRLVVEPQLMPVAA
ncbi:MAG: diguanylate cyclase [Pacificimonas sp.]